MLVDENRLIDPPESFREDFPSLDFRDIFTFQIEAEQVLVTDPIYLADVYNSPDEIASYVRQQGVFLADFGGDTNGPIWQQPPYMLIPLSLHLDFEQLAPPPGVTQLTSNEGVGTDSGSFIFLPIRSDCPPTLLDTIDDVIARNNGASLNLDPGTWAAYYEQWDSQAGWPDSFYRNIVLKWASPK
ncbi:MAG: hypothetical protein OEZ02_03715 [Anaerolineae bacterium]|nr:hypothetical protein [Anaerolineae bacterium]